MPPVVLRMPPGFSPNTPVCLLVCMFAFVGNGQWKGTELAIASPRPQTLSGGKESSRWSWQVSLGSYPPTPQRASEHPSSSCSPSIEAHQSCPHAVVSCCGSCQAMASLFPARGPTGWPCRARLVSCSIQSPAETGEAKQETH